VNTPSAGGTCVLAEIPCDTAVDTGTGDG
jgi:hypothetical protein